MGEKRSKWLEHLKAAERSGLKLSAYAPGCLPCCPDMAVPVPLLLIFILKKRSFIFN